MAENSVTITDNRTGNSYELPIEHATIRSLDLRQIKVEEDEFGMLAYDPAYQNTASCKSCITFIDGAKGILRYRGYPIEQLAEKCTFLEVAYLLLRGELPTADELATWTDSITHHTMVHENLKDLVEAFRYDAHPMAILISSVAAMSSFYPESRNVRDPEVRAHQIERLIGKVPTISAYAYRHLRGLPYVYPDNSLSYCGNFLSMMFKMAEPRFEPNPVLERALDILLTLHADHEQNCSTTTMRTVGSSEADPYVSLAAAAAALFGPLHGGANEQVLRMLGEIGSKDKVADYVKRVKNREVLLMGFGHRVYKNYDPRAQIIKQTAEQVFEVTGRNPLIDIAMELERIALQDEFFVERKLYPNVDFYSGIILQAMNFPTSMFPVLFAIARTVGWLAQWEEMLEDTEQKIARPRQVYLGEDCRDVVPIDQRG